MPLKSIDTSGSVDVLEDALQRAVGRRLERRVDLVGRRLLLEEHDEVDDRDVRRRHAHREAVELALQLRQHLADGRGRAGGRRDHRQRRGARAPQVLVRQVEQVLVVRVGVDRRHPALDDAELLVEDLGDRREAVGRARRVGDDVVLRRVVLLVVDADDER